MSRQSGPVFPANLKQVRELISKTFGDREALFDLKVRAVVGKNLVARWHSSPERVPEVDPLTLSVESNKTNRVEFVG